MIILYNNKSFLGIIPARSGSKGLKDKNIKELNKKPLIAYTIDASTKCNLLDDVIVSTDSIFYANISKYYGASVPFLRPDYLCSDTSTTYDIILYTLEKLKSMGKTYDYFILLQPTSPLRDEIDIIKAIKLLFEKNANAIVSVCEVEHPSFLNIILDETNSLDKFTNIIRRQDFPTEYKLNGAIYLCNTEYFLKYKNFYYENCFAYIMDKYKSVDIDDIHQFKFAESLLNEN